MFDKEIYVNRREALMKDVGSGLILLLGNNESPMNYFDNPYHFRQDSSFLYFFGLNAPGLAAILDVDENKEIVFGNELSIDDIVWMGTQPTLKERCERIGISEIQKSAKLKTLLDDVFLKNRRIHFLPPYRYENRIKLYELLGITPEKSGASASVELIKAVVKQRSVKSELEIAEIEKAVDISADMHIAAMKMARPGMLEAEIAAEVQRIAVAAGGQISFPIILTKNGQTLHNHYHGNVIEEGDLVLCDTGAETAMGYAGDLSSTFPAGKRFSDRQKEIYTVALNAHNAAVEMLKPGVKNLDVHLTACRTIASGLKELGFMKGDVDDAVAEGVHALFFPCGTGHMMGLDVHDMEDLGEVYVGYDGEEKSTQFGLKSLRLGRELQPGFVLTVEPGIYFIPELIDKWRAEQKFESFLNYDKIETYKDFGGLRNEEDFLITDDGYRLLGKPVPKTIEEVEALR